jgi:hypothetical protein
MGAVAVGRERPHARRDDHDVHAFMLDDAGVPSIEEMSLMATCSEWIPVEDRFEVQASTRRSGQ